MSTGSKGTVLLTGANGFIAVHITKHLIQKGYSVVGTVREESKSTYIKNLFKDASDKGDLEFAVVEDITKDGAFDAVLKSKQFDAVLHTSSPFHFNVTDPEKELMQPAIMGTKGILESISKVAPSVKRVVIVSSFASVVDYSKGNAPEYAYSDKDWNPITYAQGCESAASAYTASKKLAEEAGWEYMKTAKPHFALTTLCPPMVFGPPEQEIASLSKLNTSASQMYGIFTGKVDPVNKVWLWVDVRDIALAHVLAIESEAAANERYLITGGNYSAQQFLDYVWKAYPERAEAKGISKGNPGQLWPEGGIYKGNSSKSEKDLGIKYKSFDVMCHDTFEKFLQMEKEGK